jgi:hypothetical protein
MRDTELPVSDHGTRDARPGGDDEIDRTFSES